MQNFVGRGYQSLKCHQNCGNKANFKDKSKSKGAKKRA
jgi:hypothetical protein